MRISFKTAAGWLLKLAVLALAVTLMVRFLKNPISYAGIANLVMLAGVWIVIGAWLGRRVAGWLGERAGRLYWPADQVVPPPPYFLIELYLRRGDLALALAEYEKILRYHPGELSAHQGRLKMLAALDQAPAKIEKAYLRSLRVMTFDDDRAALRRCYEQIKRLEAAKKVLA
ncbi:MAG: hypothetical protein LBK71_09395 [Verrucomicrobiales bacterium]|jgi:tetratricopeptide (TPR) repeat protein|nr:hypothetical protein [Verrucomicrobiales bacterium]